MECTEENYLHGINLVSGSFWSRFFVDDEEILKVDPGPHGFYGFGGFEDEIPNTHNPWVNSPNKMAPFDKEVRAITRESIHPTKWCPLRKR